MEGHIDNERRAIRSFFTCYGEKPIPSQLYLYLLHTPYRVYPADMAPSALEHEAIPTSSKAQHREPLKASGVLDSHEHFDVTPSVGREYPTANLVQLLNAPNSDELLRDLAITSK